MPPKGKSGRWLLVWGVVGASLLALLTTCGGVGGEEEVPVPTLAATPEAGAVLAPLLREWAGGTPEIRLALEPRLLAFGRKYPDDGAAVLVRVLRAYNALERGQSRQAIELASPAAVGPPGTQRDLATLAIGAAERRTGKFARALERLDPLADKLIDPWAGRILGEELTRAAMASRQWRRAVRYMDRWLRRSDRATRSATLRRIERLLGEVEPDELLPALDGLVGAESEPLDDAVTALLVAHVAALAAQRRDSGLARSLLERFRPLLGAQGEPIARLAASTGRPKVTAGTLGLVLALDRPEFRDRSADVVAGVTFGLGLPGSTARLVTRVDRGGEGGLEEALHGLEVEGAAVVIAGIAPGHALRASQLADAAQLPIVLLTRPPGWAPASSRFTFVVGEDDSEGVARLLKALRSSGERRIALVGSSEVAESADSTSEPRLVAFSCGPELDAAHLRAKTVEALLVHDGARCGREALAVARQLRAQVAFGLGVAGLGVRDMASGWYLSAGLFPLDSANPPPQVEQWLASRAQPPSWWTALGRDAAVLGWAAVSALEDVAVDDDEQVAARRRTAAERLAQAKAPLWTTSATGFDANRQLVREVTLTAPSEGAHRAGR